MLSDKLRIWLKSEEEPQAVDTFGAAILPWRRHRSARIDLEPEYFHRKNMQSGSAVDWWSVTIPPQPYQSFEEYNRAALNRDLERQELFVIAEGEGEEYEPLVSEPDLFLKYARIGEQFDLDWDKGEEALLRFVEEYGLPKGKLFDVLPTGEDAVHLDPRRCKLSELQETATLMMLGVALLSAVTTARVEASDFGFKQLVKLLGGTDETFNSGNLRDLEARGWAKLATVLRRNIKQTYLFPLATRNGLAPRFVCDSLLSGMWLQLYMAALNRRLTVKRCRNCGHLLTSSDPRQQYCDRSCRSARTSRDYYQRKRAKEKGTKT